MAWASGGTEAQNCSRASCSKRRPSSCERCKTCFFTALSFRPSCRHIQPFWSAKAMQRSLAMWAGILGWPLSHATSMQKKGQHCSEGRARACETFFHTAAGHRFACRTTSTRGAPNKPCKVSCSQKRGEGSSSPQYTCRSHWPEAGGNEVRSCSMRARSNCPSGHTRKVKPGCAALMRIRSAEDC